MTFFKRNQRGFSLIELSVVLGVISVIVGAIWDYALKARQTTKVEQTLQAVGEIVDFVRNTYSGQIGISGGVSTVVPYLVKFSAFPQPFLQSTAASCNGVSSLYAITPWRNGSTDACGTFQVCAWNYNINPLTGVYGGSGGTTCETVVATSVQYFSIELTNLDYGSCVSLATGLSASQPTGLKDVLINGNSGSAMSGGLPVKASVANSQGTYTGCTAGSIGNQIDFLYSLRAPLT